jgi:hypothetical protein
MFFIHDVFTIPSSPQTQSFVVSLLTFRHLRSSSLPEFRARCGTVATLNGGLQQIDMHHTALPWWLSRVK